MSARGSLASISYIKLVRRGFGTLVEAGTGVGGTWYWNRYPGARFDSESYSYAYFFSGAFRRVEWSEHFAGQPETERYLNYVVDRSTSATTSSFGTGWSRRFDERTATWTVATSDGRHYQGPLPGGRYGRAVGAVLPRDPGRTTSGVSVTTRACGPRRAGRLRRVARGGDRTGASAVQLIPVIAGEVAPNCRLPAPAELVHAAQQRPITDESRRVQSRLRGDRELPIRVVRRLRPPGVTRASTIRGRALGALREPLEPERLRQA